MISAWWLLLLIPAYVLGAIVGWALPYVSTAIRFGCGLLRSFEHAANEMTRDARVLHEDAGEIIDVEAD